MKFAVIGYGGHSKVICELILSQKGNEIIGYFDDKFEEIRLIENTYFGPVLSAKRMADYFHEIKFVIAIGNNKARKAIANKLDILEKYYATVIHKSAIISPTAKIGNGSVVMPNSVINADTEIGLHAIINTGSIIEHDSIVGDFVHVSPGVTLTGAVHLDEGVSIGAGSTIIPNRKVGKWSVIGAGATVINDIPAFCTAVGVPARISKVNEEEGELIDKHSI
ncbi:acetyltransferase [Neobacillus soli]|uniref:acetyltransferase n=1 Tax=Neobacillus soli TaxID=220688 RepID=UPI000823FB38|nr:acetyltransferase [Neobacillus soli]